MNAGIQGLAADIFKVALVRLDAALADRELASRLVLQVHDEVIVEVPPDEEDAAAEVVIGRHDRGGRPAGPLGRQPGLGRQLGGGQGGQRLTGRRYPEPDQGDPLTSTPQPGHGISDEEADSVRVVRDEADRIFSWRYERERPKLVTLYNKAAASQWNSVTDLDWSTDVDPERVLDDEPPALKLARVAATLPGSPLAAWGEREFRQLGVELFKAQLSQFMHGEQGAMMTAAKLVETVPWIDAKYYASTQTMDEARHTEVFARYCRRRSGTPTRCRPFCRGRLRVVRGQPLGYRLPGHADNHREPGSRCVRRPPAPDLRAPPVQAASLCHGRRGPARGFRDRQPQRVLPGPQLRRAKGSPGVPSREHLAQPPTIDDPGGVGAPRRPPRRSHPPYGRSGQPDRSAPVPVVPTGLLLQAGTKRGQARPPRRQPGYLREKWGEVGLLAFEHADDTASDFEGYDVVGAERAAERGGFPAAGGPADSSADQDVSSGPGPSTG